MRNRTCSVDTCKSTGQLRRGMCKAHYMRWVRHGDPEVRGRFDDPEDSFKSRTVWRGECLIWTGSTRGDGYGRLSVNGKVEAAHRFAWERANGQIPSGKLIDHMCFNRLCCNIDHLRLANPKQNQENRSGATSSNSSSGVRGVHWDARASKWRANVRNDGHLVHCGMFATIAEAEQAAITLRNELFTHSNMDHSR